MRSVMFGLLLLTLMPSAVAAQSLYLKPGERAVEVSAGWSVGPSSNGLETFVSFSPNGRLDVGVGLSRYKYTFGDGFESKFTEYQPFVRYFAIKETAGGAPLSLALSAQLFVDDYASDEDSGKFVQFGTTVFKSVKVVDGFELQPFAGFAFVAESYRFGGGPAERAQYLTRDLGVHFTTATDRPWIVRATLVEQSFRRETYRGARIAFIRRM